MKNVHSILIMLLLIIAGCGKNNQPANELSTVDVTAKYPYKELILQDFSISRWKQQMNFFVWVVCGESARIS